MTKAKIEMENGTKITIEGTPEDVSTAIKLMQELRPYTKKTKVISKDSKEQKIKSSGKKGIRDRTRELISDGFFKKQRSLHNVKDELENKGHIYPVTSISPTLIRLVRTRELRRLKDNKKWTYVVA